MTPCKTATQALLPDFATIKTDSAYPFGQCPRYYHQDVAVFILLYFWLKVCLQHLAPRLIFPC